MTNTRGLRVSIEFKARSRSSKPRRLRCYQNITLSFPRHYGGQNHHKTLTTVVRVPTVSTAYLMSVACVTFHENSIDKTVTNKHALAFTLKPCPVVCNTVMFASIAINGR